MSSADETLFPFAAHAEDEQGALLCPSSDDSSTEVAGATWPIRRAIVRARAALISLRLDEASRATAHLNRLLGQRGLLVRTHYRCTLAITQAALLVAQDDLAGARGILMTLPCTSEDSMATTMQRYLDWKCASHEHVRASDSVEYLSTPIGGSAVYRILSLCVSAALAFDRLHLTVCASLAAEALELAQRRYGNHSPLGSWAATLLAQVAYEQGRFDEAEVLLRPRIAAIRASGVLECVASASVLLARLALHRGRQRAALASLRDAEALGRTRRWPRLVAIAAAEYVRVLLAIRNHEKRNGEPRCYVSIEAHAHLGMTSRLRRLFAKPIAESLAVNEPPMYPAVEAALLRACSATACGSLDEGYEILLQCLRVGAARGLRMVFVDADRRIYSLLENLYYAFPMTEPQLADLRPYIATLLRFTLPVRAEEPTAGVFRSLSQRETGILRLISHGMSNKRIAQSLGITPETVKSHAKSIFVKLATRTRAQAVARAEAIGLL